MNPYYSNHYTAEQHESLINFVISSLESPNEPTIVSKHYSNERNMATEVQAYAKISGKDWTYYVKNLEICIGRDTESKFDVLPDLNSTLPHDPNKVDIDLGPAKVVSRKHAIIKYNIQQGYWELHVIGRNGAKVNFRRIHHNTSKSGPPTTIPLQSGTILDIGGTQMIFILPDQIPLLSESALDHLIPKLTRIFGLQPSTNNPLINDLIKNSPYAIQERERLKFEQSLQHPLNHSNNNGDNNNNNNNNNNNASIAFQNLRNSITDNSNISSSKIIYNNNTNPTSQEFRIFKMYSTIPNNNLNGNNGPNDFNNHQFKYSTLIHSNIPSTTTTTTITTNNVPYSELSGPTTIVNGDFSYNVVSQSSSEANMKRLTSLVENGFPNAMDYATDLSLDENRSVKPPYSYATMITQAILSSKEGVISLSDIYRFISTNYSYYRYTKSGWQNSIRHNLSLNKAFEKVPRRPNEPGKGMKWRVSEKFQKEFLNAWYSGNLSKIKRSSPVTRQLYIHLSKYHRLPGRDENGNLLNPYDETPSTNSINQTSVGNNTNNSSYHGNNQSSDNTSASNSSNQDINNPHNNAQQLHTIQITFNTDDTNNNAKKTGDATAPMNNEIPNNSVSKRMLNTINQNQQQKHELYYSQDGKFPQENNTNSHNGNQNLQNKDQNIVLPKIVMDSNITSQPIDSTSTASPKNHSNTGSISAELIENINMKNNDLSSATNINTNQDNKGNVMRTDNNNNSENNITHTAATTTTTNSDKLSASNIMIPLSGSKLDHSISNGYDTLLRSPNKAFQISAMEAYTPERGSIINQQETKSPGASNTTGNDESSSENKNGNDTSNNNSSNPAAVSSENGLTASVNSKKQLLNSNKSSPGVWNLLQFSSAVNTPAIASINSREDNDMNVATFSTSNFNDGNGTLENNKVNSTSWTSASSPLKTQSIITPASTDEAANREAVITSKTIPISMESSVSQNRDLILDTENAKLTTVNN